MKELELHSVAHGVMEFTKPIILEESQTTRRCFYGTLVKPDGGEWELRGTLMVERKGRDGWHRQDGALLNRLKGGEITKLELSRENVNRLLIGLNVLRDAAKVKDIDWHGADLVVGKKDEVAQVGRAQKAFIEELVNSEQGGQIWGTLRSLRPELAARLADAELLKRRKTAIEEFERELSNCRWTEPEWEKFFRSNEWIFGLGLRFQYLSVLQNQANYGGAGLNRKGEQKGEFLMHTEADERFTVLVEIKRPDTKFFGEHPYRSGVPGFNSEFANAISQVQVNSHTWEYEGSKRERDARQLDQARIRTISPRAILVCGHLQELADDFDKQNAFELLRCNLRIPEILTFDELLARAKFIVRNPEP
ncbi:MAG: Shedu immune nuclease family protein [Terracidiphilus sp.]